MLCGWYTSSLFHSKDLDLQLHVNPFEKVLLLWLNQIIVINVYNFNPFLKPKQVVPGFWEVHDP